MSAICRFPCQVFCNSHYLKISVSSSHTLPLLPYTHTYSVLVRDGRYFYSYMPTGVYAELRNASNHRFVLVEEQTRAKNRLQKWVAVYFPEYKGIYTHIDAKGGLPVLKQAPTPEEIVRLGVEGIIKIWKDAKLRGNGHKKAMLILNAAMKSIGLKAGLTEARMEIQDLIEDYELQTKRLEQANDLIKELCQQVRYADKSIPCDPYQGNQL